MHNISNAFLETAGTIDLNVEIKLTIDNTPLSIDIYKRFIDDIKDLYKVSHAISYEQKQNAYKIEVATKEFFQPLVVSAMTMSHHLHHLRRLHVLRIIG